MLVTVPGETSSAAASCPVAAGRPSCLLPIW
jgi:hypothetical protein